MAVSLTSSSSSSPHSLTLCSPRCQAEFLATSSVAADKLYESRVEVFEKALAEYDGFDPLKVWEKYVKFVQQARPADLLGLLERCTAEFKNRADLKGDIRYLKIWCLYADLCEDPADIFAFLENHGIGHNQALFYEARATMFEAKGDYSAAEAAFELGINRKAGH